MGFWNRLKGLVDPPRSRGSTARFLPGQESLEARITPDATASPAVAMISAATEDSQGVVVSYEVAPAAGADPAATFSVGIYRSADATFDSSDVFVGAGEVSAAAGAHAETIALAGGLPLNPERPYVLAVAEPEEALASGDPGAVASFQTYSIAVVTHGGIQHEGWKNGPAWQLVMAKTLLDQGYNAVLPFNWVVQSNTPGAAARQAPRLLRQLQMMLDEVPDDRTVNIHFIGHSEGAVVNSVALRLLGREMPEELRPAYFKVTMLDPHAANTAIPGQQYSVANNFLGWIAKGVIDDFQSDAKDPPVTVPAFIDEAEVFYQHTGANADRIYNLWGQVPVRGDANYFDLTSTGVVHSGKKGVYSWYQNHVVPLLGDGAPEVRDRILVGEFTGYAPGDSPRTRRPTYAGAAYPGSTVRLFAGPASDHGTRAFVGEAVAGEDGRWSIDARPLYPGRYRFIALAIPPRPPTDVRLPMVPTTPLGSLVINARA
jgi:hypothetical protein